MTSMRSVFNFPDPVNETSARIVAAGVVIQAVAFLLMREGWILVPLVAGFLARVLTGPTLSPLGQFATRIATPALERTLGIDSRRVPGPPKRFAQGIGLAFSATAGVAWLAGWPIVTIIALAALVAAATLEAVVAVCLGCIAHSAIWGCAGCNDIGERLRMAIVEAQQPAPTT
ncbi:MAG: DUF4395 domain-containing protein [Ilumatobacter sp.]|nr:DUF4395 domain-containing protein [Ilumatobacter sp.]